MKKPEKQIETTGDTFEDAKAIGKYIAYRKDFLSAADKDVSLKHQELFEEGADTDLIKIIRVAHLYGNKLRIKGK